MQPLITTIADDRNAVHSLAEPAVELNCCCAFTPKAKAQKSSPPKSMRTRSFALRCKFSVRQADSVADFEWRTANDLVHVNLT